MGRHRLLYLILLLPVATQAGETTPAMVWVGSAPSGSCKGNRVSLDPSTGKAYLCPSTTWSTVTLGGGGGGGTPGGVSGNIQINSAGIFGAYAGTGAAPANQWLQSLNANGAGTWAQPAFSNISGTATSAQLPDATGAAKGAVVLTGDLGGTAASPSVVDDSHNHTTTTISGLDAGADFTAGTLAQSRGGMGVASLTCSGTDKVTCNGTACSCAADQTGGGGGISPLTVRTFGGF